MARGKVQMKRIENPVQRQVTFCKRRIGLLKKAKELSVLCDADIGVLIFSAQGKLYELSTKGSMQELVERYMKSTRATYEPDQVKETQPQPLDTKEEIDMLKLEIQILQKGLRYGSGEMECNFFYSHATQIQCFYMFEHGDCMRPHLCFTD